MRVDETVMPILLFQNLIKAYTANLSYILEDECEGLTKARPSNSLIDKPC